MLTSFFSKYVRGRTTKYETVTVNTTSITTKLLQITVHNSGCYTFYTEELPEIIHKTDQHIKQQDSRN